MESVYRPCVLAVFTNIAGRVLVAERADNAGCWQFPQGGVEADETREEALFREAWEEIGCREFIVTKKSVRAVRYDFPPNHKKKEGRDYRGQEQTWFLARFLPGAGPDLARATDKEFVAFDWIEPSEAVQRIVEFKRSAYRQGLHALGLLPLKVTE